MKPYISIDFETRSTVDLRKTGVYPYAAHHSTDILCMAYSLRGSDKVHSWEPGQEVPEVLNRLVASGIDLRAWNAGFEYIIWRDVLAPRYGFAQPRMEQWWDTAAEAAAMALPRSLGGAASACGLPIEKDEEGHKLMMKMCKPRSIGAWGLYLPEKGVPSLRLPSSYATKAEATAAARLAAPGVYIVKDDHTIIWWDDPAMRARLLEYCKTDVVVEKQMAEILRPLPETERAVYLMNQRMNDIGVPVDRDLVEAAKEVVMEATDEANATIKKLTRGQATKVTSVAALRDWVNEQGVTTDNLRKDTVRDFLAGDNLPPLVREVLQIRQDAGRTSVAKLDAFLRCVGEDGRIRGMLLYHGASTGRWAGRLVQPQNFPRPMFKRGEDIEALVDMVKHRDYAALEACGYPIPVLISYLLRSMFRAEEGETFMCADYSQVEARVLAWLAGQDDLTELFRSGGKVYETMASYIFDMPVEEIGKDSFERQIGKNSELGFGFQMGEDRFAEQVRQQTGIILDRDRRWYCEGCDTLHEWHVDDEERQCPKRHCGKMMTLIQGPNDLALRAKTTYRTRRDKIVEFWKDINECAIRATRVPGKPFRCGAEGRIVFMMAGSFLYCRLPSGRMLCYAAPELREKALPEPYEHVVKESLFYLGVHSETNQWRRLHTYGGHLTENVVQAVARDLIAEGMLRLKSIGFQPILTVHDEVLVEVFEGEGANYDLFLHTVNTLPPWAEGLPLTGEGWQGLRYRK